MSDRSAASSRYRFFYAIGLLLALIVALNWFFSPERLYIGDGGFNVYVTLLPADKTIESAEIATYYRKEEAEEALRGLVLENRQQPYDGGPIKVYIHTVARWDDSRLISRGWEKYLVVVAKLNGNRYAGAIAEVPDKEDSQLRIELNLKRTVIMTPVKGF